MATRKHIHEEILPASPETVFAMLHTPSAIREWWSADRALVVAEAGGVWMAAWGPDEDDPDYATAAKIAEFEPPRRLVFTDYRYAAKNGKLPFDADFETEFLVTPHEDGAVLRVTQDGFPAGPEADAFYEGCRTGWENTFAGIRAYLKRRTSEASETERAPHAAAAASARIREVAEADRDAWVAMRAELWPDASEAEHRDEVDRLFREESTASPWRVVVAEDESSGLVGFAEFSIRPCAEGCSTQNVAYLEGWFVASGLRRSGVGRALVEAGEAWGRSKGCTEIASDAEPSNATSLAAHRALGFEDAGLVCCFRKDLAQ